MGAERKSLGAETRIFVTVRVVILTALVLVVAGFFIVRGVLLDNQSNAVNGGLEEITALLDEEIENNMELLESTVAQANVFSGNGVSADRLADYLYSSSDAISSMSNIRIYCTEPVKTEIGVFLREGEAYITASRDYTDSGYYAISKMTPNKRAVVTIEFSLEKLQDRIEDFAGRFSGEFMIADGSGVFYAHSNAELAGIFAEKYESVIARAFAFSGERLSMQLDGEDCLVFSRMGTENLCVIACVDSAAGAVFQSQNTLIAAVLILIALALIAELVISVAASARISEEPEDEKSSLALMRVKQNRYFSMMVVVFVTVSAFFIYQAVNISISSKRESLKSTASSFGESVSDALSDAKSALSLIDFSLRDELDYSTFSLLKMLERAEESSEIISNVFVYNPLWENPVTDKNGAHGIESVSDGMKQAYAAALNGGINLFVYYSGDDGYCIMLSKAVFDKNGGLLCVAGAECEISLLVSAISAGQSDGYVFLTDSDTNIISHPNEAYRLNASGSSKASQLAYKPAFLSYLPEIIKDYDGKTRICLVKEYENTGFFIVVAQDLSGLYSELLSTLIACALILVFGIIMIALIMRLLSKWQISTAKKLTEVADIAAQNSRAKADFLANMSHEIRTPMNAIIGMCELILREQDISESVREYCYNIRNSGRSLLSIINDILDFSKIESEKMELIEDEFNIASTLNDVINMAVTRKANKKLELIIFVDPDIPSGLYGDEIRIRQVIVNIVTNAIKYTNEGCIIIRVLQTKHDYGINLSVIVEDTGIGISEENLEKLFSGFQQVDTKKNRAVEGAGLGLAISKRLITSMGGFINVKSRYGKGSEFRFVIPLKVTDSTPFIAIKDAEHINAAGYIDLGKLTHKQTQKVYRELMNELGRDLRTGFTLFKSMEELVAAAARENYTHIFTAKEEYIKYSEYFKTKAKDCEVIVIQDRTDAIEIPAGLKCIYKPFYTLSIASVFNREHIVTNLGESLGSVTRFVAPQARVLIVDDNAINLKVAVGLMRPYRMQLVTADSASEAISMLRSKDIHIVFMDHMMPETDGVEATKIIRSKPDEYYRNLPIIALTANTMDGVREVFIDAGMNDFLAKPIELSALDRVLKAWLPKELISPVSQADEEAAQKPAAVLSGTGDNDILNVETGLFYTYGDTASYLDILGMYVKTGREKRDLIQRLYDEKDWKNYVIEVHALKSTSLSIGSKPLSESAKELEIAGKAQNYALIEEKNGALLELYERVILEGERVLRENAAESEESESENSEISEEISIAELSEITQTELLDYIERIRRACVEFDSDEIIKICEEAGGYQSGGVALKPFFDGIKSLAEDFEYDEAQMNADKIPDKIKGGE